jgi:hypothetical protein
MAIVDAKRRTALLKLILAFSLFAISAAPSLAQTAEVFSKGDPTQCWTDVREIVHKNGKGTTEDDKTWTIQVGHYSSMAGDVVLIVHVAPDKDKKGDEGCRIYVAVQGGGDLAAAGRSANDRSGSRNFRIASQISAEVESMKKGREKKEKQQQQQNP